MAAEGVCSWGGPKILGDPGRYWAQSDGCPQPYGWGGLCPPGPPSSAAYVCFYWLRSLTWAWLKVKYSELRQLGVRQFNIARRVCPVWNTSSHDVVNASSGSSFTRKLDAVNLDLYTCYWNCNQVSFVCGHSSVFVLNLCVQLAVFVQ